MFSRITVVVALIAVMAAGCGGTKPPASCIVYPMQALESNSNLPIYFRVADPTSLPACGHENADQQVTTACSLGEPVDIYMDERGILSYICTTDEARIASYRHKYAGIFSGEVDPNSLKPEPISKPGFDFICWGDKVAAVHYVSRSPKGAFVPRDVPGYSGYCYQVHPEKINTK